MCGSLTRLLVEENLELFHRVVVQRLFYSLDGISVSHLTVHKTAPGALLHDLSSIVAGYFAEGLRTVDDRVVDNLCICQKKTAVGCKYHKKISVTNYCLCFDSIFRHKFCYKNQ